MSEQYALPNTIDEALAIAADALQPAFLAGGTDLYVSKQQGNRSADVWIDLSRLTDLCAIKIEDDTLIIGAMTTLETIIRHSIIEKELPVLQKAAHSVATPVIRRTATLGGNLLCENRCIFFNQSEWWRRAAGFCLKCNGDVCIATGGYKKCLSKFVSDTAPVLIAAGATSTIRSMEETRTMPLETLYSGDGIRPINKDQNSLLTTISVPLDKSLKMAFKKLRPRKSLDFTSLTMAVAKSADGNVRIAIGGVDPQPVLIAGHISDADDLIKQAVKKPRVIENDYYPRTYRKQMLKHYAEECFKELDIEFTNP